MLTTLLDRFLDTNNELRLSAEKEYQEYKATYPNQMLVDMVSVFENSNNEGHRALAAVLLRGIVLRESFILNSLSPDDTSFFRERVLNSMLSESASHVQRKLAHTVAALAKAGDWPELLNSLPTMAESSDPKVQQLLFFLIDKLAEYIGPFLLENMEVVWNMIAPFVVGSPASLAQVPLSTRVHAVSALVSLLHEASLSSLISASQGRTGQFEVLLEGLSGACAAMNTALQDGDEESFAQVGEALAALSRDKPTIFQSTCEALFEIATCVCQQGDDIGDSAKCIALEIAIGLLTNPAASTFSSNHRSRQSFLTLCIELMSRVEITDGLSNESPYVFTRPPDSEEGFGDEDGDEDALSEFASYSLEKLFKSCPIEESLGVSSTAVFTLLQESNVGCIRAGLVITAILFDTLGMEMQDHTEQLLEMVLQYAQHETPRIRYCAFRCCKSMILAECADEEEEEEDDEGGTGSVGNGFAARFHDTYLPIALKAVKDNFAFPRVEYAVLNSLRAFFDPQKCPAQVVQGSASDALGIFWEVVTTSEYPLFALEEAISLIGNTSLLSPQEVVSHSYSSIMSHLKEVISCASAESLNDTSYNVSRYKGKCLECAALVGRAAGIEIFHEDAVMLLQEMVNAHEAGLDYSEPMASYIVQTCARIAGILGENFRPYVDSFIPPLLAHISEDVRHEIITEENIHTGTSGRNEEGVEEFTMYKRGVGEVKVVHRTYEASEKELSCSYLQLVCVFAPDIILATAKVVSTCLNENMYLIAGALISDAIKIFLRNVEANEQSMQSAVDMVTVGLATLTAMRNHAEATSVGDEYVEAVRTIFDSIRETLKVVTDAKQAMTGWNQPFFAISTESMTIVMRSIVQEAKKWIERIFATAGGDTSKPNDSEEEEELWLYLSDASGWLVKAFPSADTAVLFSTEMAPFLTGLLDASADATPLLAMAIGTLADALEALPAEMLVVGATETTVMSVLVPKLFQHMASEELTVDCIYGMGVFAMHGDGSFDQYAEHFLSVVGGILEKTADIDEDTDESVLRIRDSALCTMLKVAVFKGHVLKSSSVGVLESCLSLYPLQEYLHEAREAHNILMELLCVGDRRLLGEDLELLPQCLMLAAQLQSGFEQACNEEMSIREGQHGAADEDDFWEGQFVRRTFGMQFEKLLTELPQQVDITVLRSILADLPEEVNAIFSRWA